METTIHKNARIFLNILSKITEWSLYILIFFLPFSKSIIEISIIVAIISWALRKLALKELKLKNTPLNAWLILFFFVNLVSMLNADYKGLVAVSLFSKCLKYIVLYFVVVETIDTEIKLNNLLKFIFMSAIIVMIDSYIQYYIVHFDLIRLYPSFKFAPLTDRRMDYLGFPTGPFPFPNDLSAWMVIALMSALCLFLWGTKNNMRLMLGAFLGPFSFLFYLTNTRSSWLGVLISFISILFIQKKKAIIVLLFSIMVISMALLPKTRTEDILGFSSMQDRFYMWRIGWKIFSDHPIIGNGLNTSFLKFKELREDEYKNERGSHFHNGFLQIAADTGIIGLTAFLLLIGSAFRSVFRYFKECSDPWYKYLSLGLAGGLLAFLTHSFFDTNLQSLPLVTLFWFSLGIMMSLRGMNPRLATDEQRIR